MEATINWHRKMGIEIETVVAIIGQGEDRDVQQLLASVLNNQGISTIARSYSRQPVPGSNLLCVEYDTSLRDESRYRGIRWAKIEIKTAPLPWDEIERILPPTLDVIRYLGARCNASTGLHVHHHFPEAKDRPQTVRNLQHLWWRYHNVMYGLVPPSRFTNVHCRPPRPADAKRFDACRSYADLCQALRRADRYDGLNLTNLANQERMTVEWRIHGGTTDWSKIKAWALSTQRWVEHAVKRSCHYKPDPVANTQSGLNSLLVTTGLKSNSRIYCNVEKELREAGRFLLKRWKHFNQPQDMKAKAVAA